MVCNFRIFYFLFLSISFIISLYYKENPFDNWHHRFDSTVYQYWAKVMLDGQIPYRDFFDHKGPVVYFWHVLGYLISPVWGQWILELLLLFVSMVAAYKIAIVYLDKLQAFLIVALVFLNTPANDTVGNTENLAVTILLICLKIFNDWLHKPDYDRKKSMWLGGCCFALLFMKPNFLVMPLIFIACVIVDFIKEKNYRIMVYQAVYFLVVFLTLTVVLLGWLFKNDAMSDFLWDYITFNVQYVKYFNEVFPKYGSLVFFLKKKFILASILACCGVLAFYKKFSRIEKKVIVCLVLSFLLSFVGGVILSNQSFDHYAFVLYPIGFMFFVLLMKRLNKYQKIITIVLAIAAIFNWCKRYESISANFEHTEGVVIANIIKHYVDQDDKIQVLSCDMNRIYLLSNRMSATKYPLSCMIDRIDSKLFFESMIHAEPEAIIIMNWEYHVYLSSITWYWPEFEKKYVKLYANGEYVIYLHVKGSDG